MSEEIKETRQEGILFTIDCLKNHKINFDYCLDELIKEATNLQTQLQQKENIIKEEKKIEKIDLSEWAEIVYIEDWEMLAKDFNRNCNLFVDKINEIIDYLEENK